MEQQQSEVARPRKPGFKGTPNLKGRPKGIVSRHTRLLKDAILFAAGVAGGTMAKPDLEMFLIKEAKKKDNRAFMSLLGKVLPMTVAFDKNKPLMVQTRIELVRPEGGAEAPRDVTPRQPRVLTIDGSAKPVPPAPAAPVRVRAPRSGT